VRGGKYLARYLTKGSRYRPWTAEASSEQLFRTSNLAPTLCTSLSTDGVGRHLQLLFTAIFFIFGESDRSTNALQHFYQLFNDMAVAEWPTHAHLLQSKQILCVLLKTCHVTSVRRDVSVLYLARVAVDQSGVKRL